MMHPKPQSQSEQSGSNTTKSGLKRIGKGALSQRLDLEPWGAAWSGVERRGAAWVQLQVTVVLFLTGSLIKRDICVTKSFQTLWYPESGKFLAHAYRISHQMTYFLTLDRLKTTYYTVLQS